MKNDLDLVFEALKKRNQKALIAYLAAGYPGFKEQETLIKQMETSGVDILEVGVPFSDPIADGPTIQFASQLSLQNGTTLKKILTWIKRLKTQVQLPIVIMSYVNPILKYGWDRFAKDARAAGVSAVIIPDMIPEECREIEDTLARQNIHMIYLIAPTTPKTREKFLMQKTKGFLYAVSVAGVTGARKSFSPKTKRWLAHLKKTSRTPVCVGFGISTPSHIKQLKNSVDGFIVGSALIDVIRRSSTRARPRQLQTFIQHLSKECHHAA